MDPFAAEGVKTAFDKILEAEGMKMGKLAQPVRVAVTGGTVSPGIFETLCLLGKKPLPGAPRRRPREDSGRRR